MLRGWVSGVKRSCHKAAHACIWLVRLVSVKFESPLDLHTCFRADQAQVSPLSCKEHYRVISNAINLHNTVSYLIILYSCHSCWCVLDLLVKTMMSNVKNTSNTHNSLFLQTPAITAFCTASGISIIGDLTNKLGNCVNSFSQSHSLSAFSRQMPTEERSGHTTQSIDCVTECGTPPYKAGRRRLRLAPPLQTGWSEQSHRLWQLCALRLCTRDMIGLQWSMFRTHGNLLRCSKATKKIHKFDQICLSHLT